MSDQNRGKGPLITGGLIVLLAGVGLWWWHSSQAAQEAAAQHHAAPPVPVAVTQVSTQDLPVYLTGVGTIQAYNTVTVRTRVDGELQQVNFNEGQFVKQGDVLAQIDPRPFKAAVDQAVAKKAQDEAQLANAKLDLGRANDLASRGFDTKQQQDTQKALVDQLTALVQADQAAIETAQLQLDYSTIRSPLNGRTGFRLVDRGSIVHATDTTGLVEIVQLQPIAAVFTLPESDLKPLAEAERAGQVDVWAVTPDGKTDLARGKLLLLNNQVDMQTGTIKLKAEFANADLALWPGQSISARVLVRTIKDATTVPPEAVLQGNKGAYAFVVDRNNKAQVRNLTTSGFANGRMAIESGLKPGETVVTGGQYRLKQDTVVQATDPATAKSADGTAAPKDQGT
jgi:multidrug efflux system membrane fusion protein